MSKLDNLGAERKGIMATPYEGDPILEVPIRKYVAEWLVECLQKRDAHLTDLVNIGVGYAASRELALKHTLQMLFRSRRTGQTSLLPPLSLPFVPAEDDVLLTCDFTDKNLHYLQWLQSDRKISPATAVHDGLRLVGAAALALEIPTIQLCIIELEPNKPGEELGLDAELLPKVLPLPPDLL